jgi:hypothetical protein
VCLGSASSLCGHKQQGFAVWSRIRSATFGWPNSIRSLWLHVSPPCHVLACFVRRREAPEFVLSYFMNFGAGSYIASLSFTMMAGLIP